MRINIFSILFLSVFLISCLEEIDETSTTFEKVYGGVGTSQGERIIELSNGNLLLLGKTGVPLFNLPSEINEVIVSGLSATEIDQDGNLIRERIIPIPDIETGPFVDYQNIRNHEIIEDAVETADGGILFSGQFRFSDLVINIPGVFDTIITSGLPFYGKLDSELNLQFIDAINKQTDPNEPLHTFPVLKRLENGRIYLLMGFRYFASNAFPTGYTLFELNEQGQIVDTFFDNRTSFKGAKDFELDRNGDIVLIGQRNQSIALYKLSADAFEMETNFTVLDEDLGESGGINRNPMYIRNGQNDDYATIVVNSRTDEIRFRKITQSFGFASEYIDVTGRSTQEFCREFIQSRNGDYILLTVKLDFNQIPSSILYRLDSDGNVISRNIYRGDPGDILEAADGSVYLLTNPIYNDQLSKMTLRKLKSNGTF